ncbi:MAG: GNAT family N-acetyltransferase [Anaerolineales bacterium]
MISTHKFIDRIEVNPADWDSLVDKSDEAWLWHRFHAQDVKATRAGRRDLSFALIDQNRLVAVVPVIIISGRWMKIASWSILEAENPVMQNDFPDGQKRGFLALINEHLVDLSREFRCISIEMSLAGLAPAFRGGKTPRVNPLILSGYENKLSQTWMIDLRIGEGPLWEKMEKRARNAIRSAEKQGVKIRVAAGNADLEKYYLLHVETYKRTGVGKPHPQAYFENIWEFFLKKGLSQVFFAEINGEVIAAENFSIYKSAAKYYTGASNELGLNLNANSAIQWQAIQWMLANGIEWYETGEAFPNRGGKRGRLSKFKQSFGGDLFPLYRGRRIIRRSPAVLLDFVTAWRDDRPIWIT